MMKILFLLVVVVLVSFESWAASSQNTTSPIRGVITAVDAQHLELKDEQGRVWTFEFGPHIGVSVEHLQEHMTQQWPVSVFSETSGQKKMATKITD